MKVLWIGGWGTSPEWGLTAVERWKPDWNHEWVSPGPTCAESANGSHDWVGGYSFGAFLMLRRPKDFPAKKGHFFLAPFLDLKRDAGLGGMVDRTQLKFTQRWLKRDPFAALSDFYQRGGLNLQIKDQLPYNKEDLLWGIDELLGRPAPIPSRDPGVAVLGEDDPLIEARKVSNFFPRSIVVSGAGHLLEDLRDYLKML